MEVLDSKQVSAQPFKRNATYADLATLPEHWTGQTARLDRGRKREIYAEHNVGHLWFADPANKTIEVLALDRGRYEILQVGGGADRAQLAPFATELDLAPLWSL